MKSRKLESTNYRNESGLIGACPMTYTNSILGKRWKPIILWKIHAGSRRFSELLREIPLVSRKMLYQELKELAERGLDPGAVLALLAHSLGLADGAHRVTFAELVPGFDVRTVPRQPWIWHDHG
jgi:hypothetical protein